MKALLLIDVQNDFVPGGALPVAGGADIIPLLNGLQPYFDLVVATQDWHPAHHGSFASQHPGQAAFSQSTLNGLPQTLWPDHCVQNRHGAALHPALDTARVEAIFRKGTDPEIDSYSGFFDNGHRKSTGLAAYLRDRGVRQVYVAGLAADFCVYFSAKDAQAEGFETFFLADATRAINATGLAAALADLRSLGVQVVQSAALGVAGRAG